MSQNEYIGKTLKPWPILVDHYTNQMLPNELSDYRATIISSRLPLKIGALTLVQAKSDANNISLIFTKKIC